jgi:hypothetical protein
MFTILAHLVQAILDFIDTFTSTQIFLGNRNGVITHGFVMHQHPNIADGIVMMADDAEVTDGEGVVEALADLGDEGAGARASDDAIASAEFMRIDPAVRERLAFVFVFL